MSSSSKPGGASSEPFKDCIPRSEAEAIDWAKQEYTALTSALRFQLMTDAELSAFWAGDIEASCLNVTAWAAMIWRFENIVAALRVEALRHARLSIIAAGQDPDAPNPKQLERVRALFPMPGRGDFPT